MSKEALYFGCSNREAGHYVFRCENGRLTSLAYGGNDFGWVRKFDGTLAPLGPQEEGKATLSYVHGYSIIAFWDRSVDTRPGSNAMFLIPGKRTFDEAMAYAVLKFPVVFERFDYVITEEKEDE